MKIGVISDSHDNTTNLEWAINQLQNCGAVIHCGDVCAPESLRILQQLPCKVHVTAGNCDNVQALIMEAKNLQNIEFYTDAFILDMDGTKIAATHYPEIAIELAQQDIATICYGHTHKHQITKQNGSTLLNPGDLQGRFGQKPKVCVLDTENGEMKIIEK